jgi:two-component system, NtrC family, response regulator AtoC
MRDQSPTVADSSAFDADPAPGERALLAVYFGPELGGGTRIIPLGDGAEVTFGRTRVATVPLDSERVSRLHAKISRNGTRVVVEDLGSRNGTKVNGTRIEAATEVKSGDQVEVGPATVVVSVTSAIGARPRLGSGAYLDERLRAEADRGMRYQRSFGLLMMRLSGPLSAVDAAVERLARLVRPMDTIAEYGPDEIAILLPETDEELLRAAAEQLVRDARAGGAPVEVRVGLAAFPRHGTKPDEILGRARSALRTARGGRTEVVTAPAAEARTPENDVIVVDAQMRRVYQLVQKVADTPMTVLIIGETGTGKEMVAEALHRQSSRKTRPFVRLNCACLPETLLESELFGHERGSFTGADKRKIGFFEAADGGTIFLDEIGEITAAVQAKLLRVLEEHKITRVGGTQEIAVDVRVVCATNRDLESEVGRGAFREDLYFRISAFTILVPPLRDRKSEILPLTEYFLGVMSREHGQVPPRVSEEARRALERYSWPGNVRELRNALERALVLHAGGVVELEDLPERLREEAEMRGGPALPLPVVDGGVDVRQQIADVERASILAVLEACGGNQTHAARKLGLSRRALIYRMEKHGLKPPPGGGRSGDPDD